MQDFISLIVDILSIELSLGSVSISLGGIALGYILINAGIGFYNHLSSESGYGVEGIDSYIDDANDEIRDRIDREASSFWDDYYGR